MTMPTRANRAKAQYLTHVFVDDADFTLCRLPIPWCTTLIPLMVAEVHLARWELGSYVQCLECCAAVREGRAPVVVPMGEE